MKLFFFVAALAASTNAIAQEAPSQPAAPPADRTFTDPNGFKAEETPGGYQPAGSPYSRQPAPGESVVFSAQPLTPTEAYPPPAPLATYPACKPKQYNQCKQRR